MTKKKTMKNIKTPNKFNIGGYTQASPIELGKPYGLNTPPTVKPGELIQTWDPNFKPQTGISEFFKGADFKNAAGLLGGVAGGLISNGFSTTGGQILSGIGDAAMMFNPLIGGAIKAASSLVNRGFGTKWNQEGLAKAEGQIEGLNNFQSGASDFDTLAQDFTKIGSMNKTIKASDLGEDGWFVNRTTNKANKLNTDLGNAYNYAMRNANNVADNIASSTLANLERNYAAFGGPLFAYGGQTHGSDFTNGLMFIKNGGTHESNPYEGVPISMDQEGNPNLVEEGEVIWNDYVFSNRLKVPKSIQKKYKLGKREMTFANAVNKLSKESEERPNDPISMRGLEDILMHMAIEQETLKSKQQPKNTEKNKFPDGGTWDWNTFISTVTGYNGSKNQGNTPGTYAIAPYDGNITEYENSDLYKRFTDYVLNNSTNEDVLRYLRALDAATPDSVEKLFGADGKLKSNWNNIYTGRRTDGKYGVYHLTGNDAFLNYINAPAENPTPQAATANRYFIRNADGTVTQMTENLPFEGLNENGRTWAQLNPDYIFGGKQVRPQETIEGVPTTYTDYYYDLKEEDPKKETPTTPVTPPENLPTWMRYAPVIGHGALALTDAFGLTNKPNYSNAEAIIKASDNLSSNPIKFNPIGDYLTYNPFDTEYHANQLRAVSGATRRSIMNTSRGNRAAALTGILAADNNTMNQMGDLYRKAAEYNLEQRHKVGEFNKDTNKFNSEGFFKADAANQSMRQVGLEGLIKGYAMKEQANLMSDQAKAANISGLLTSLGNIGYENANRNMMNWGMATGTWAPSQWKYDPLTGKPVNQNG